MAFAHVLDQVENIFVAFAATKKTAISRETGSHLKCKQLTGKDLNRGRSIPSPIKFDKRLSRDPGNFCRQAAGLGPNEGELFVE
jgi:hypothetical protein